MARHKIAAGEEIDVLNATEAEDIIARAIAQMQGQGGEGEIRAGEGGVTDANGNIVVPVYVVPVGCSFRITRLVVDADGFTAAAPFRNPAGAVVVRRSGETVDFVNLQNGLPALSTDSKDTGTRWRNGEIVELQLINGPANNTIRVAVQGFLRKPTVGRPGRVRGAALEEIGQMDAG